MVYGAWCMVHGACVRCMATGRARCARASRASYCARPHARLRSRESRSHSETKVISEGGERRSLGGVPREQKMLKGHLPRVIYHQVYSNIRRLWCMVYGAWCDGVRARMYIWCMVYGVWCMVHGAWCLVYGVWCIVHGVWCMVYGVWCMVYGLEP